MEKKKLKNKEFKPRSVGKKPEVNWDELSGKVEIVGTGLYKDMPEGKVFKVGVGNAKLLVEKGYAKLK